MTEPDALPPAAKTPAAGITRRGGKGAKAGKRSAADVRAAAAERQRRHRDKKRTRRDAALTGQLAEMQAVMAGEGSDGAEDDGAPLHPGEDAGSDAGNDAAAAVEGGQAKAKGRRAKRGGAAGGSGAAPSTPQIRARGWLREGQTIGVGLSSGQLRDLARRVMEVDFLPYLQELIADPHAKDTDKLRAGDIVAKLSVGYMTPDVMNAEDAPELPPPIFETTDGALPGEEAPVYDDAEPAAGEPVAMGGAA